MNLIVPVRKPRVARQYGYLPHHGARERARRLRQVKQGTLTGSAVTDAARYAAHGLIAPNEGPLLVKG